MLFQPDSLPSIANPKPSPLTLQLNRVPDLTCLFAKDRREGINKYKNLNLMESPEEINRIFSQSKLPSVLGSESFINRVKKEFFHKKLHDEIPESRRLAPEAQNIKKAICKA
jgi:hypothetical protein